MNNTTDDKASGFVSKPIQSFESGAVLKASGAENVYTSVVRHEEGFARQWFVAGLPVALLITISLSSVAARVVDDIRHGESTRQSGASANRAKSVAGRLIQGIVDTPISPDDLQFTEQSSYSIRRSKVFSEWNVTYDSVSDGQYLVRLNSDTQDIYAVNRVQQGSASLAISKPSTEGIDSGTARRIAEQHLSRFLKGTGTVTPVDEETVVSGVGYFALPPSVARETPYTFSYLRKTGNGDLRILKIGIARANGALEYYWNPSAAQ